MPDLSFTTLFIALTFVVAGFAKGMVGVGLLTVAMGLLSLIMAPAMAAAMLIIPAMVTNVWQLVTGPSLRMLARRLATMMVMICIGTAAGIGILTGTSSSLASGTLGAALAVYGVVALAAPRFTVPPRAERWLAPWIGLLTGLLTGATGVFAIPAVPYLGSLGLDKNELIQAMGLSFTVSTLALAAGLAWTGHFKLEAAGYSVLAVAPALAGMFLGQWARNRLDPVAFRRWFLVSLIALGLYMLAHAF